jgi:hypothetical protein
MATKCRIVIAKFLAGVLSGAAAHLLAHVLHSACEHLPAFAGHVSVLLLHRML